MSYNCPNPACPYHQKNDFVVKDGSYFRTSDSRTIQRFRCQYCRKRFSSASFSPAKGQKKRRINGILLKLLCSGVSMRRAALILTIHRVTVTRKLIYLAMLAREQQKALLENLKGKVQHLQFDDLITIEHTKLKPLTITLAVDAKNRTLLGAEVGKIAAFGHLAELSRKKYGKRKSEHKKTLKRLFEKIHHTVAPNALVESDEHKFYPEFVKRFLPQRTFCQHKGGRGCVAGQGELKKLYYDPLFILNHSCAMLRANINRLVRKSWCTTKSISMLQHHLDLFISFYNLKLIKQ